MSVQPPPPPAWHIELADGVVMPFQSIENGSFRMGARGEYADEEPIHIVSITQDFYLGTFPVTQAEFEAWTKSVGIEHENHFAGDGKSDHPAETMDWHQAKQFCEWLSQAHGSSLPAGFVAALPTEAQWEYACRAGTDTEYHTGYGAAALADAGWFDENSGEETHPVGKKLPNRWGLYDMHGNVWEWCRDAWDARAYQRRVDGVKDPEVEGVSSKNPDRVVRGGSWGNSARNCRAAFRDWYGAVGRGWDIGFRVCLVPGPVAKQTIQDKQG